MALENKCNNKSESIKEEQFKKRMDEFEKAHCVDSKTWRQFTRMVDKMSTRDKKELETWGNDTKKIYKGLYFLDYKNLYFAFLGKINISWRGCALLPRMDNWFNYLDRKYVEYKEIVKEIEYFKSYEEMLYDFGYSGDPIFIYTKLDNNTEIAIRVKYINTDIDKDFIEHIVEHGYAPYVGCFIPKGTIIKKEVN